MHIRLNLNIQNVVGLMRPPSIEVIQPSVTIMILKIRGNVIFFLNVKFDVNTSKIFFNDENFMVNLRRNFNSNFHFSVVGKVTLREFRLWNFWHVNKMMSRHFLHNSKYPLSSYFSNGWVSVYGEILWNLYFYYDRYWRTGNNFINLF